MQCPACSSEIPLAAGERVAFAETCPRCAADLHVCRACTFHDPSAYNECRESSAERVSDRERANRCEYFRPGGGGGGDGSDVRGSALDAADALFRKG